MASKDKKVSKAASKPVKSSKKAKPAAGKKSKKR